jgi:hypothetical protein
VWRHIGQSLQGSSHLGDDTPCQDNHRICVLGGAEGNGDNLTLVACVADGAGSAKHSDLGSSIVCTAIIENATKYFEANGKFENLRFDDVVEWCEDARTRINDAAMSHDARARDFASTLCTAIIGPKTSFFFQIGDGAIILGNHFLYGVVFWPQSGEYANSTNFLTLDQYQQHLEFITTETRCTSVALMTDGIERIALRFDSQTPHTPFFEPLFRALRSAENVEPLNEGLRGFLNSASVQHRSDDDKTLVLATRTDSAA